MRKVEIEGKRFGLLTVISHAGKRYWNVKCDCGTEKKVRSNHLTCGLTVSCGCYARGLASERGKSLPRVRAVRCRESAAQRVADGKKSCSNPLCTKDNPQEIDQFHKNTKKSLDSRTSWCRTCRQDQHLKRTLGIGIKERESMINDQGGRCANLGCGVVLVLAGSRRNAHVDHDHETGKVRGVLCRDCNLALGYMQDSPEMITGLLEYARKHRQLTLIQGGVK